MENIFSKVAKIINDLQLNVKLLNSKEFIIRFHKNRDIIPPFTENDKEIVDFFANNLYGSSAKGDLIINKNGIINSLKEFARKSKIKITDEHLIKALLIYTIHEYAEYTYGYKHCNDKMCPLFEGTLWYSRKRQIMFRIEPCEMHKLIEEMIKKIFTSI